MSVIKANTHQVGSNADANKNVVLTVNNSGDLVISKGAHDQPTSWTEIGRVSNSGGFQSDAALLGTAGAVANTDLMVVNQGGINKKITAGTFRTEFATEAVAAKVAAEAARDAAQLASGVYATTAAGLAATTSGKYFNVPASSANESLILYLNSSGTAVEQKRYPSAQVTAAIKQLSWGPAFVVTDQVGHKVFEVDSDVGGIQTKVVNVKGNLTLNPGSSVQAITGAQVKFDPNGNLDSNESFVGKIGGNADTYLFAVTDAQGNSILAVDNQGRLVANFDLVPSTPTPAPTPTPTDRLYDYSVNQVFGYGQSLSVGQAWPAISTKQNYDNLMFYRGMRPQYDYPSETDAQWYASLVPAIEANSPTWSGSLGECTTTGMGDMIKLRILAEDNKAYTDHQYQMLLSCPGWGATTVAQLSKGGTHFPRMVTQATYGKNLANAAGKTHAVQAVTWTQGESDYLSGTARATYTSQLAQLITDINTDIKAVTGQTKNIPMISYQIASHKYYGGQTDATANPYIALAQSDLEAVNPLYYIACAMYPFTYWAGGHIVSESTRWLGGYYGLAYKRIVINQEDWQPLKPVSSVKQSNFVEIRFHVPYGKLTWDTTQVPAQTNYGFDLVDQSGASLTISSISIIDTDRIRITSNATIPANARVRYAWKGTSSIVGMGNLRDSQGDDITFNCITATKRMDNWCLIFDLGI